MNETGQNQQSRERPPLRNCSAIMEDPGVLMNYNMGASLVLKYGLPGSVYSTSAAIV